MNIFNLLAAFTAAHARGVAFDELVAAFRISGLFPAVSSRSMPASRSL